MFADAKVIIFLGPPGSGKGTQAARLSPALRVPTISTGDMLRRECQSSSNLGRSLQSILAAGQLVGDDLINQVVANRLRQSDCKAGYILDGYPRTVPQAQYLDALLGQLSMPRPVIFDFDLSAEDIVARLSRRRQCTVCGAIYSMDRNSNGADFCERDGAKLNQRADDKPSIILERLRLYEQNTGELVRYYGNKNYHRIPGARTPEAILDDLLARLQSQWSKPVPTRRRKLSIRPSPQPSPQPTYQHI